VVVTKLNIERIALFEPKANAPLIIDRNGVLALAVTLEGVETIARRYAKVADLRGHVNGLQFSHCPARHIGRHPAGRTRSKQLLGTSVRKGLDHAIV
jgi:hypothetical protein